MDIMTLADELGLGEEEMRRLILTFLETTEKDLVTLGQAFSEQDAEKLRTTAHHIKGAAGNLELSEIAEAALAIESEVCSGTIADPTDHIARIRSRMDMIRTELTVEE